METQMTALKDTVRGSLSREVCALRFYSTRLQPCRALAFLQREHDIQECGG
jgi:hypothetical protein